MWNLKYDPNEFVYETEIDRLIDKENRLMIAKGEGAGGETEEEIGVSKCKLLYIDQINNKVLLCSTGSYIQYPGINGKEYKKMHMHV